MHVFFVVGVLAHNRFVSPAKCVQFLRWDQLFRTQENTDIKKKTLTWAVQLDETNKNVRKQTNGKPVATLNKMRDARVLPTFKRSKHRALSYL